MCTVDCPFCDRAVRYDPGDDEFDCPTCAVRIALVDELPADHLALAA